MKTYSQYKDSGIDWMGEIPSHWERLRLKDVSYMYSGLTGKSGDDFRCDDDTKTKPFVPFTNVLNNIRIDFNQFNRVVMEDGEEQNRVKENDLVFLMSSEDYDSIAKSAVVDGDPGEVYLNSFCRGLHFTTSKVYAPFINYQLNAEQYRDALRFEARGFTRINIKKDRVESQFIALPPFEEQCRIAKYLDEKCDAIDECMTLLEKKRDAYVRLKTSIINHAVTNGLDSNTPLRDSGIDWIGKVPIHWTILRFKDITSLVKKQSISDNKIGLENIESKTGKFIHTNSEYDGNGVEFIENDIIYGKLRPYLQKVWLATFTGNAVGDFFVFRAIGKNDPSFIKMLMLSEGFTAECNSSTFGAKMPRVSPDFIQGLCCAIPPIEEQKQIANYLEGKCAEIDTAIAKTDKQIDAYKRLKKSLINEVVTGKRAV